MYTCRISNETKKTILRNEINQNQVEVDIAGINNNTITTAFSVSLGCFPHVHDTMEIIKVNIWICG